MRHSTEAPKGVEIPTSTITWLHLSDLHSGKPGKGWDARRVMESLVHDLRQMENACDLRPDFIFFTGDIAFGELGKGPGQRLTDQFRLAQDFLEAVRGAFKSTVPRSRIFIVPGNHDVNRHVVGADQTFWLRQNDDPHVIHALMEGKNSQWRRYMERLTEYRNFLHDNNYTHLLDDPNYLIYGSMHDVAGVRVGIGGFNTVWSCCRNSKDERGKLWMGGHWQLERIRPKLKNADIAIALLHHPTNWLVEAEDTIFRRDLERDFRFILHGHEHAEWVTPGWDGWTWIAAGACYQRSDKQNGYNWVRLDLETRQGQVWLREYDSRGGGWVPGQVHGKTSDRGVWDLQHLNWLKPQVEPMGKTEVSLPSTKSSEQKPVFAVDMPLAVKSPFVCGPPTLPEQFVDREDVLRTVFGRLYNGESTAIVGEPHIGKSSLLLKLADAEVQRSYLGDRAQYMLIHYHDLHPIEDNYNPRVFWEDALETLWEHHEHGIARDELEGAAQAGYSRRSLRRIFRSLNRNGWRLVLLLDEFERLLVHPHFQSPAFFALLRSLASVTGGLALVLASRESVAEMNERSRQILAAGSPFFNIMIDLHLGPFDETSVNDLLDRAGECFSPQDRLFIRLLAGRHPYLLQAMAAALLEANGEDRHAKAATQFYERVVSHFDDLWRNMNDRARTACILLSLVEIGGAGLREHFTFGKIKGIEILGSELWKATKSGLVEQVEGDRSIYQENLLQWQGRHWAIGARAFTSWVRDVVVTETRRVIAYEKWLADKAYRDFMTEEEWACLLNGIRIISSRAPCDVGVMAGELFDAILRRNEQSMKRELKSVLGKNTEGAGDKLIIVASERDYLAESSAIRVLFLAANPASTARLQLDKEVRSIDQALRGSEFRDNFILEQYWAVRVADLQESLLRYKPDIVHFSGHGSGSSEIIVEDTDGSSHPVSVRALSHLFSVLKDNIRCVVLNACFSELQAEGIARYIDCVVGMSREISDRSAISFATSFYQALGYGRDVKTAFDLGCLQVDLEDLGEQDKPKLLALNVDPQSVYFVGTS